LVVHQVVSDLAEAPEAAFAFGRGFPDATLPANCLVDVAVALRAAREFWATGRRDAGLVWDVDRRGHELVRPPGLEELGESGHG
jgi:hypothetical protein